VSETVSIESPLSPNERKQIEAALQKGIGFMERQGWETYDSKDLKAIPLLAWTYEKKSSPFRKIMRLCIYGCEFFFPLLTRRLCGVPRSITAGGMAHLARTYTMQYARTQDTKMRDKAREVLKWLEANHSETTAGKGWGLPFAYKGDIDFPVNVANSHTTMTVGNSFLLFYSTTGEEWALEQAKQATRYLGEALHYTHLPSGSIASSYTALDKTQVINVSADNASLLLRVGAITGDTSYWELGEKEVRFVLENQNPDGSWYYFSAVSKGGASHIDNYHTMMVLGALVDVLPLFPKESALYSDCLTGIERGMEYYLKVLVTEDGMPAFEDKQVYPIDAHGCGQALVALSESVACADLPAPLHEAILQALRKIALFTVNRMMYSDGCFAFRLYKLKRMRLGSLRWAQSLICYGLSLTLKTLER
jgi:hypothetical protein